MKLILERYQKSYDFRFCREAEAGLLMDFIDRYWKQGHILARNLEFLNWQYYDRRQHRYNFILAVHRGERQIHGILGFIPTDLFDEGILYPMRWGAVWKIREDVAAKGLGLAMKFYMYQNAPAPYAGGIGLSSYSKSINAKMGEKMGVLKHYYMINREKRDFRLIKNPSLHQEQAEVRDCADTCFLEIDELQFQNEQGNYRKYLLPYKSVLYYVNRFFRHPIYHYHCGVYQDASNACDVYIFYRICSHDGANCIMIVDFIGNEFSLKGAANAFQKLLLKYDAEYLSFYEYGLDDSALLLAGLKEKNADMSDEIVLPLYYEPFEQKNVIIDCHYFTESSEEGNVYFFKGDADQDRPNEERG